MNFLPQAIHTWSFGRLGGLAAGFIYTLRVEIYQKYIHRDFSDFHQDFTWISCRRQSRGSSLRLRLWVIG
jgi:hypothetical protein